jgi:DNA phosphorothioation-dependent restriction protein DptG
VNIQDNIAWLQDLAVHSLENGQADQANRLYAISKWIDSANAELGLQVAFIELLLEQIKEHLKTTEPEINDGCTCPMEKWFSTLCDYCEAEEKEEAEQEITQQTTEGEIK